MDLIAIIPPDEQSSDEEIYQNGSDMEIDIVHDDIDLSNDEFDDENVEQIELPQIGLLGAALQRENIARPQAGAAALGAALVWSRQLSHKVKTPFSGPVPGPTNILDDEKKAIDFFHLFFTENDLDSIVAETNSYAELSIQTKADPKWIPTTREELSAWIGIRTYMSIDHLPNHLMYFADNWLFGTSLEHDDRDQLYMLVYFVYNE